MKAIWYILLPSVQQTVRAQSKAGSHTNTWLRHHFDCACFACESAILPERLFSDPSDRLGPEHGDAWSQAMRAYFLDQTDEAATKDVLQKLWMDGAMKLCAEQKYDWCPAQ